jgi:N-acetylglucosamine-6-phosphate deacetylase
MRLRSERIVGVAGVFTGEVVVREGVIADVVADGIRGSAKEDVVELGDRWLVPGFIDVHVHGGGGAQCNTSDPDEVAAVARFHAGHGTTALLATTVSAAVDELVASVGAIRRASDVRGAGARVLGAHLEGPFLSPARPGAMDPRTFLEPDERVVQRLLGAGGVRMMTLAPELRGALELVRQVVEAGAVASLGHSDASYEQARAAVMAGARSATHAFNAMAPLDHRSPGLLGAVLDLPEVSCELICDGRHVDPVAMRLLWRVKGPEGMRLVTDAMEAAGMPDGEYRLGAGRVRVSAGRATTRVGADESLAGSTLTMDAAVAGAVRWLGLEVPEAVTLASLNPARLLGLDDRLGAIAVGMDADLAVLDEDLRACATLVRGEWVRWRCASWGPRRARECRRR